MKVSGRSWDKTSVDCSCESRAVLADILYLCRTIAHQAVQQHNLKFSRVPIIHARSFRGILSLVTREKHGLLVVGGNKLGPIILQADQLFVQNSLPATNIEAKVEAGGIINLCCCFSIRNSKEVNL